MFIVCSLLNNPPGDKLFDTLQLRETTDTAKAGFPPRRKASVPIFKKLGTEIIGPTLLY